MRKTFYVHGDIHNHVDTAQQFLDRRRPHKVIWLGDFFDNFNDTPEIAEKTAKWVKKILDTRPNDVFILSNHDVAYRFPQSKYEKHGWTEAKQDAIDGVLSKEDWDRFVIAHEEKWNDYTLLFSHAGFVPSCFPNSSYSFDHILRASQIAIANGPRPQDNPWLDAHKGPLWVRWNALPILDGVCQIVGHTPTKGPRIRGTYGSRYWNLNLDCADSYYACFKDKRAYAVNRKTGTEHLLKFPDGTETANPPAVQRDLSEA